MKISKNSSYYPCVSAETRQSKDYDGFYTVEQNNTGIPMRLEIASQILPYFLFGSEKEGLSNKTLCELSLGLADALIEAHNETCEKGE